MTTQTTTAQTVREFVVNCADTTDVRIVTTGGLWIVGTLAANLKANPSREENGFEVDHVRTSDDGSIALVFVTC